MAHRLVSQEYADALRDSIERIGDKLEALHLPRPETVEDWQVLGRIIERPEDYLHTCSWTAAEIYDRAMALGQREKIKAQLAADVQAERENGRSKSVAAAHKPTKSNRSTERGEGRAKLIAAMTRHHKCAESGCLNTPKVAMQHYLMTTDEHFKAAVKSAPRVAQKSAQQAHAVERTEPQAETTAQQKAPGLPGLASSGDLSQLPEMVRSTLPSSSL